MKRVTPALAAFLVLASAGQALAWGDTGHRYVGRLAMEALPAGAPAFLRTSQAASTVAEIAREPDRWRNSGKVHDSDRDAAHFIDLNDDGTTFTGKPLEQLPPRRSDYVAELLAAKSDEGKAGYLPYAMVDGWQQLAKDLAYWRMLNLALATEKDPAKKAWYAEDLKRREALTLRDIGVLGHYVGDGSQPLHLSVHYNGWGGDFPNPQGYTLEKIHNLFEGPFVRDHVPIASVRAAMKPYKSCTAWIETCVQGYLKETAAFTVPLYEIEKRGGFRDAGTAEGQAFASERLAAGASELRDLIVRAWEASETVGVGYPATTLKDVQAGKQDPWKLLYGDG
jgi:hypothetical protein